MPMPRATVCSDCIRAYDTANKLQLGIHDQDQVECQLCMKRRGMLSYRLPFGNRVSICTICLDVANETLAAMSAEPDQPKEKHACAASQSSEQREVYYKEGLRRLSSEPQSESTGKLIAELIEIKPSKQLFAYARAWLKKFPHHKTAIKLVAAWLSPSDSNSAAYCADYYLRTVSDTMRLGPLVRAIAETTDRPWLLELVAARLEHDPHLAMHLRAESDNSQD